FRRSIAKSSAAARQNDSRWFFRNPNPVAFRRLVSLRLVAYVARAYFRKSTADPGFAVRFYRLTATLLSKRLRDLVALFITSPAIKPDTKTSPVLQGPVRLFDQTQPDFQEIERIVQSLPALSQICDGLQHGISDGGALTQRVKELSVATMAAESLQLFFEVAKDVGLTTLTNV